MRKLLLPCLLTGIYIVIGPVSAQQAEIAAINSVLDEYHAAAATGDWDTYFALMSDDGVFLGTDAGERWGKSDFQDYASASSGWVYTPRTRNVNLTPDGNSAWFDEILLSVSYGTARGTGVLIKTGDGWKISQYHLSLPIPNGLARQLTDEIKAYEAQQ